MISRLEDYCLSLPGARAEFPFGPDPKVMKVGGKMFALLSGDGDAISLKCDPAIAERLREQHAAVKPGYHLNKKHWNTIALDGTFKLSELTDMVRHSYDLVVSGLPKAERAKLK